MVSYRKGYERGMWYEIKTLEDTIKLKQEMGKNTDFEKGILKSYKRRFKKANS